MSYHIDYTDGAFKEDRAFKNTVNGYLDVWSSGTDFGAYAAYFDASSSSSIYGNSAAVTPLSLSTSYILKY